VEGRCSIMQITDVHLKKVDSGKMKAIASITIDNEFVVREIKVIESQKGLFVAMPSKKKLNGEHKDIAHPINQGARDKIESAVLDKYNSTDDEPVASAEEADETEEVSE